MKRLNLISGFKLFLILIAIISMNFNLQAQDQAGQGHHPNHESRLLIQLLNMDTAQIQELRHTIERIESMSSEEKKELAQRVQRFHQMPPKDMEQIYKKYQSIPPEEREIMKQRWREMSHEERRAWRKRTNSLDPAERLEIIKKEGILPGHRYPGKRNGMPALPKNAKPEQTAPDAPATAPLEAEPIPAQN
jgi:hypothetical protein